MVRRFEDILERVQEYNPNADVDLLRKAYVFSAREHRDQKRRSGEPYLVHPLEVSYILAEIKLDTASIVAGLLHDVVEDTLTTIETVRETFGDDVAHIVAGVTKISKLKFASSEQAEAENLRKMILAMVDDIRVILVKLADRLHNMRTLEHMPADKQNRIAIETKEIYAPIAHRLGIGRLKSELDDLAFRYGEPEIFEQVTHGLSARRKINDQFIHDIRGRLEDELAGSGIEAEITGRVKAIHSIYRKMKEQKIPIDEVYDYVAFRIQTRTVKDCYGALGIVHSVWRPVPGRIKDYIAMPKPNMYQSLHTSVMTDKGHPFEVQIRTHDMHRVAEEGIAAHWQYKERDGVSSDEADKMTWLRQILEWQQDLKDPRDFLELVKIDLFPEEVYCFTPKGKVLSFRAGATPLDFAYAIHTEVGQQCVGAKVNGKIVPLKYTLANGDIVEIMTQTGRQPSRDWLNIAQTGRARSKIRAWLNANERAGSISLGRELTEKAFRKYKVSSRQFTQDDPPIQEMLRKLGLNSLDDYYAAVAYGKVSPETMVTAVVPDDSLEVKPESVVGRVVRKALGRAERGVKVSGMDDMLIALSKCCNPVRGENIIGYISRGKGVAVHSVQCPNVKQLLYEAERRIDVEWTVDKDGSTLFDVKLILDVEDRQGLLAKIVSVVSLEKANIRNIEANTYETADAKIVMVVSVADRKQMERVIKSIRRIKGVREVERAWR
ncbi:MAG: bifunctional (p)ppGpp synthetase/guanosine-3',5'-bis(diphosphate) 3'-pyrophosphohydrolase [bacterium]|nr:bifunctional (p)ppGpp synthetase/guanosine-3',5'-bis(diphosphate) 3'-pyrophosphohydrolase [bacterium]